MFYDIEKTARVLTVGLFALVAADVTHIGANLYAIAFPDVIEIGDNLGPVDWITFAAGLVFFPAAFLVLTWIYRANANAQRLADGMTVSPGWNVGWFFVPVANLWKPFAGLRETWAASRDPDAWDSVPVPLILRAWWMAWLVAVILDNALLRMTWNQSTVDDVVRSLPLDISTSIAWIVTTILLMKIVRTLSRAQAETIMRHTFA